MALELERDLKSMLHIRGAAIEKVNGWPSRTGTAVLPKMNRNAAVERRLLGDVDAWLVCAEEENLQAIAR
jgi:hypothetical protein